MTGVPCGYIGAAAWIVTERDSATHPQPLIDRAGFTKKKTATAVQYIIAAPFLQTFVVHTGT